MDLIDIVYQMATAGFNNEDNNRLDDIVKRANKEYLYHQSMATVKEEIFRLLEQSITNIKNN